jgi:hypothetical protein
LARECPAAPQRRRSSPSFRSWLRAAARASLSHGGTRRPVSPWTTSFGEASDRGGHDRESCRHRFEDRQRQPLRHAREDEHVRSREQIADVGALADQPYRTVERQTPRLFLDLLPVGPVPDDESLE